MKQDNSAPDCQHHKKDVAGITDTEVLAEMIGDLHYETLAELFQYLAFKMQSDSHKDTLSGRLKLAARLHSAYNGLMLAQHSIEKAWQISRPFMEGKTEK